MSLASIFTSLGRVTVKHGPEILTGLAVVGSVNTAVLASRATAKAQRVVDEDEINNGFEPDPKDRWKRRVKIAWRLYIPTAISAVSTVTMIVCANRLALKRETIVASSLATAQLYLNRYTKTIEEVLDEEQQQIFQDRFSEKLVQEDYSYESGTYVHEAGGEDLFLESISGRYFKSTLNDVRSAILSAREQIENDNYITLNELYDMLNLDHTAQGDYIGWTSYSRFNVTNRPTITKDGRPCITLVFEALPKAISMH